MRKDVVEVDFRKPADAQKVAEPPVTAEQADRVLIAAATGLQAGLAQALMNAGMLLTALKLRADAVRAGGRSDA
jgi:hypothetical protein